MTTDDVWPPELDGVTAAPDHHEVLFENDRVRVIETVVKVGDTTPVHTHPRTVMYVVSGDHFIRKDDTGRVMVDTRDQGDDFEMPPIIWSDGTPPHVIENPGDKGPHRDWSRTQGVRAHSPAQHVPFSRG